MSTLILNFFLQLQALVAVGAVLAYLLRRTGRLQAFPLSSMSELRIHYFLFSILALLLLLPNTNTGDFRFEPVARVFEAEKVPPALSLFSGSSPSVIVSGELAAKGGFSLHTLGLLGLSMVLLGFFFVARDYWSLHRLLRRALVIRSVGRVRIAVLEDAISPFSVLGLNAAWVILPDSLWQKPEQLRVAIAHELQHHRQRDTLWCHLFAPLRALCFFHPLRLLWSSLLAEIQELACDEALVSQKKISPRVYSRCLIDAAETAVREGAGRSYAAAPALFSEQRLLKRRIENMYQKKQNNRWLGITLGLLLSSCLAASAWASGQWLVDAKLTRADAEKMAVQARKSSEFPITVNDAVLNELNYYLGTAKGRAFIAKSVANLEQLRVKFDRKLAQYRAPEELLAVGLIESGFQNLPASANPFHHGAGIWQFIPSTARVFGMRVDDQVDERLDIDLETDAAFRYLTANKMRFNDWLLGVMAYNMGERALDKAILKSGTRDPWELVKRGYENDSDYLPKFMAAVLILKNPQVLK